jgi:hypothetical protein
MSEDPGRADLGRAEKASVALHTWSDASTWTGGGLRREVFFFPSSGEDLYGSLYASLDRRHSYGLVICSSWGVEADRSQGLSHSLARSMAASGGAALVFHYPGYGDSTGDVASVTMDDLADAVVHATAEASKRHRGANWILVGMMFGASVAALALREAEVRYLLLIQPALDPGAYLRDLVRMARRARLGVGEEAGFAFGYPVPANIIHADSGLASLVKTRLAGFHGRSGIIQYSSPSGAAALDDFQHITVPGTWTFGAKHHPELRRAAADWIDRVRAEAA